MEASTIAHQGSQLWGLGDRHGLAIDAVQERVNAMLSGSDTPDDLYYDRHRVVRVERSATTDGVIVTVDSPGLDGLEMIDWERELD